MISVLLIIALLMLGIVFSVYVSYFSLVVRTKKKEDYLRLIDQLLDQPANFQELPSVTVLIPAYNEESNIFRKLRNISTYDYPKEKIEVILLDDSSSDKTCKVASKAFEMLGLKGRIMRNDCRTGVNALFNRAIPSVDTDLVLLTDADVAASKDALKKTVIVAVGLEEVGAVTGKMLLSTEKKSMASSVEADYRVFYDLMSTCESAIYSTFPGYGAFILLRKSAFAPIPIYQGSSDGNLSLGVIRKRLKYIYVPQVVFFAKTAEKISDQRMQKVRRAARLIQSTFLNRDLLFNEKYEAFGKTIFPLRFAMMTICPPSFFIGLGSLFLASMYFCWPLSLSLIIGATLLFYVNKRVGKNTRVPLWSFLFHQLYLVLGLLMSYRKMSIWKPRARKSY